MKELKFYLTWEEEEDDKNLVEVIDGYIKEHGICEERKLSIGNWGEAYDENPEDIIQYLIDHKDQFPNVESIYLGDMESEECEVSWIMHTDAGPLLNHFELKEMVIKGSNDLRLKDVCSKSLKSLRLISGGMPCSVLKDILEAKLPNLEHLEIYMGVEDYGFDGELEDLKLFMDKERFPKLKYLGLKNSEIETQICKEILESSILKNLEVLDLSLGTLNDEAGKAILENPQKLEHLKTLDVTYNYMSDEMIQKIHKALESLGVEVLSSKEDVYDEDEDEEYRYPYLTE